MRRAFMAVLALALFSAAARADVLYSFTGAGDNAGTYFNVQSPTFLPYSSSAAQVLQGGEFMFRGTDYGPIIAVYFLDSTQFRFATANGQASYPLKYDVAKTGTYTA